MGWKYSQRQIGQETMPLVLQASIVSPIFLANSIFQRECLGLFQCHLVVAR